MPLSPLSILPFVGFASIASLIVGNAVRLRRRARDAVGSATMVSTTAIGFSVPAAQRSPITDALGGVMTGSYGNGAVAANDRRLAIAATPAFCWVFTRDEVDAIVPYRWRTSRTLRVVHRRTDAPEVLFLAHWDLEGLRAALYGAGWPAEPS